MPVFCFFTKKKLFFLVFLLFFKLSCDSITNIQNEAVNLRLQDPECLFLSKELSNDVIKLNSFLPYFVEEASKKISENIPSFIQATYLDETFEADHLGSESAEFEFFVGDYPLCQEYAKAHKVLSEFFVNGEFPTKNLSFLDPQDIPKDLDLDLSFIEDHFASKDLNILEKRQCLLSKDNTLRLVWHLKFLVKHKMYQAFLNQQQLFQVKPMFVHYADIKTKVYERDEADPPQKFFKTYTLKENTSSGILCNKFFKNTPPPDVKEAISLKYEFIYEPEDERFGQVSMYTHATNHVLWMLSLANVKKWYGPQILLVPFNKDNGNNSEAYYQPGTTKKLPEINMGKGDQKYLTNLRIDGEPIQHEVGHHVLYRSVKKMEDESAVLHEAVADLFVMHHTKNPCIAEFICKEKGACISSNKCLRTAENVYTLQSPNLPEAFHKRSQLISAMVWDIAKLIGHDKTADILYKSVDFFPRNCGYADFIFGFMKALELLYQNESCNEILKIISDRGFEKHIQEKNISC